MIAIIAILAAILFPVFAQAKEAAKKASAISSAKQTGTGPCVYNPAGQPQPDATGGGMYRVTYLMRTVGGPSFWTFSQGSIFVATDTSARMVNLGNGNRMSFPASTNTVNFFNSLDSQGYIDLFAIRGRFVNGILFIAAFSPDNTFQN